MVNDVHHVILQYLSLQLINDLKINLSGVSNPWSVKKVCHGLANPRCQAIEPKPLLLALPQVHWQRTKQLSICNKCTPKKFATKLELDMSGASITIKVEVLSMKLNEFDTGKSSTDKTEIR